MKWEIWGKFKLTTFMFSLYSSLVITYVLGLFVNWSMLHYITGLLAMLSILFSFKDASKLYQSISLVFVIIGILLFSSTGRAWYEIPYLMTSTIVILTVFYVLPFINSIIIVGRYDQSVNRLLKAKTSHLGQLYYRGSMVSFLLGSFLNIATISLVQQVLQKNLLNHAKSLQSKFISQAMLRGYALCLVWSPMEIMVALTIDITGVHYLTLLPWLLLFSFSLLVLDWAIGWRFKKHGIESKHLAEPSQIDRQVLRRIVMLIIYLIIFITCVLLLKGMLQLSFLIAVSLVIVPYSFAWALWIKRFRTYVKYSVPMWKVRTLGLKNYMVLFLSVGFFVSVLSESGFMGLLQDPFSSLARNPFILFVSIQCLFLGLSMVGFHPLVTISILAEILKPIMFTLEPLSIGIVLITSSLSTVMAGPYNITVSLTGALLHENPYRITSWNIGYAFMFSSMGTLIAMLLL